MICYVFFFLFSFLLRVELHELYLKLLGRYLAGPFIFRLSRHLVVDIHWVSYSRRWDPLRPEILCSWFLLGSLLRRIFALRGGAPSAGTPGPHRCCRSEPRQEPTRTQAPLAPSPFRGDLAQNGAHPRAHPAVNKNQESRVRGAYRGDCGWIECPNQLVGWGQPPGGMGPTARWRQEGPTGAVEFCSHAPFCG
jgi:hypothetical protein